MRVGIAIDLHATAEGQQEVRWANLRAEALAAEAADLDLVVVPDHLYYAPGGDNDYALPDRAVGAWESVTVAGALTEATSTIGIGHSMVNAPYRNAALTANIASTLDAVSGGRYSLGIGSGNSFDYDELGIDATDRHARFAEVLAVVSGMLHGDTVQLDGRHVTAHGAELVLRHRDDGPPLVVAANGPRTRRLAVQFGDGWNMMTSIDDEHADVTAAMEDVRRACDDAGRDVDSLLCTVDVAVDPLDLHDARDRSRRSLAVLAEHGVDEVRCYAATPADHASRMEAVDALAALRP